MIVYRLSVESDINCCLPDHQTKQVPYTNRQAAVNVLTTQHYNTS
jgi:hypothetical protein